MAHTKKNNKEKRNKNKKTQKQKKKKKKPTQPKKQNKKKQHAGRGECLAKSSPPESENVTPVAGMPSLKIK